MPYDNAAEVNESTIEQLAARLGASLREARRSKKLSQIGLATAAKVDLATVRGLERGVGTLGSLTAVLDIIQRRFCQQAPDQPIGCWLAGVRKARGYTQSAFAPLVGVSKPTIIQIEHGRGNIRSLVSVLKALELSVSLVANDALLSGARLILGDCLKVLPTLPDGSVNAIIADLPYSLTALEWDRPIPLAPLWEQFRRLLTPTGVVVLTASHPFTAELVVSNREWFKYALVWEKSRATGFLQADKRHLRKHEDILVFSPGSVVSGNARQTARNMTYNPQGLIELAAPKRSDAPLGIVYRRPRSGPHVAPHTNVRSLGAARRLQTHTNFPTSVLRFASEPKPVHSTQKPIEMMRYLVRTFSNEGDTVLDCCMGSGTTGVAAVLEGRQFIGIEAHERYFQIAQARLSREAQPLRTSGQFK